MRLCLRFRLYLSLPCLLWTLLSAGPVQAELVDDIYKARPLVEGRDDASLIAARRAGLLEVVVKASGDGEALTNPVVADALANSEVYLLGYGYEQGADNALRLRLEYDEQAVKDLLRKAGLPLWTANRPVVLAWLVVSDERGRRFVSLTETPDASRILRDSFRRRGVPLQTPLHDLQDAAAISAGEAWRQSSAALTAASRRYRGAELLAGRVARLSDGSWQGDWRYLDNGRWLSRSSAADSFQAFTDAGAELVAGTLSERYAVTLFADADQRHRVILRGVRSYNDYLTLQQALSSLEAVRQVVPEQLQGDQVSLRVEAEADILQLARIIELDARFVPLPVEAGETGLHYEWMR